MGQIKNIKLHIVTDIKVELNSVQSQSSIAMPGEHPVEKYTPYFKTSTKAVGQAGSWWSTGENKEIQMWKKIKQQQYMRENKPGAWPWNHHGWYTMNVAPKDELRSTRLHGWAAVLGVSICCALYFIRQKDWKYQ